MDEVNHLGKRPQSYLYSHQNFTTVISLSNAFAVYYGQIMHHRPDRREHYLNASSFA